jgi:acyl transferase domain-containing protein/NADPH:quinone reductase-like Zn-dependent oxidoreductase/NADP-dependent 3-hydroxy acid dehydrogenase YdfG
MHQLSAMHMLSPEGISHTFDDRANGYGRGDGIGALIVKRLSDAIRDGDTIRAVIRGTSVNADGKTPSITQPSAAAQAELINQAYEDAGLDQSETDYCECHGTGTPVGDPLELTAIAMTLGAARRAAGKTPLYVGSIKPTVGHTEGCAGLAGIFKSILLLEKGMLVPTYGVKRVNPKLKFDEWNLALPHDVVRWPTSGMRRVSVNSFGFGGANAHVILDDAYHYLQERDLAAKHNTVIHGSDSDVGPQDTLVNGFAHDASKRLFLFSGKDQTGAKRVSEGVNAWLQTDSQAKRDPNLLENLAYTLALHRTHLEHRTFALASSLSELTENISKGLPAATRSQRHGDNLVMIFTGQGAQWPGMGRELLENPIFRQSIDVSQSHLEALGCKWNAIEELTKTPNPNIDLPQYSQPLCTVVQIALVDILHFWQISPTATIGHSSGEIAAAYAATLLTHHDAIKLAYVRGLSSAAVSKQGAMMAAGLSQEEAQMYLANVSTGSAVVACINSPSSVTLSGDVGAIDQLETLISSDGKFARKLKVTTAYHSPHMSEISQSYLEMIGEISPKQPDETDNIPVMYSSLTGSLITSAKELNTLYWVNNMQSPVQFSQGLLALLKHKKVAPGGTRPVAVQWGNFLEVGPHAALQGPLRQIIDTSQNKFAKSAPYASMLVRGKDAVETSLNAAGVLWAAGCKLNMGTVDQHSMVSNGPQMLCNLPPYPWNHIRGFWHESYSSHFYRFPPHVRNDFLGMAEDSQSSHEPRWRNYLRISENPWIEDHTITGTVLYPGSGMLVMALEGALRTADSSKTVEGFRMTDVMFERGLVISLDDASPVETRISFHPHSTKPDSWIFTVYSMTNGSSWAKHCAGTIALVYEEVSQVEEISVDAQWQRQLGLYKALLSKPGHSPANNVDEFYQNLDTIGMQYGPAFRNVVSLKAVPSENASYGSVAVPDTKSTMPKHHESPHVIHPATLDSIFHLVIASLDTDRPKQAAVPYSIDEIYIARDQPKGSGALYSGYGRMLSQSGHEINTELFVSDEKWTKPKITVKNFALRQVTSGDGSEAAGTALSTSIKSCVGITWVPDLSFLTSNEDFAKVLSLPSSSSGRAVTLVQTWLNSVFLKTSENNILVAMFDESESSIDILLGLKGRTYGPKKIVALATSESRLQLMRATLGEGIDEVTDITYRWFPESELLQTLAPEANDLVIGLGVPDIAKNAATLSKLAPLVCLTTHASQSDEGVVDVVIPGRKCIGRHAEDATYVLFASSTTSLPLTELPDSVVLLLPTLTSDALDKFAVTVQTKLESSGVSVTRKNLTSDGVASLGGKSVISLLEIDSPLVYSWDEDQFNAFKTLVSTVRHLFWITHGSVLESWSNGVEFATSQGLFRVMRNEYPMAILPSLDLSAVADISNFQYVDLVLSVWRTSLDEDTVETEYAEGNGLIYIPRATGDTDFDYELQLASNTAKPILSAIGASGKPLKASESAYHVQGCTWIPDEQPELPLEAGQVEVKVEYAGLGTGQTIDSVHHAVGVVTRHADSMAKKLEIGQRVVVFSNATAKTHVRQNQDLVAPLPDGLEPQDAVALIEPLITAQYALVEVAHLSYGQTLLITNAGSAVGQALIQVAKAVGAGDIFVLVYSRAERDMLTDRFGIPTHHIFDSVLSNFVPLIQSATKNRGVDVIVSQQSGEYVAGAMSILSDFGQVVDINNDDEISTRALLPASVTNVTLARINMAAVIQARPNIVSKLFQQAFTEYILQGPSPLTVLSVTSLSTAMMKSIPADQIAVVSLNDDSPVLIPAPSAQELKLDSEATYVLAGGLGALGLDIANWMVEYGAKDLVFLSRSGGSKNQKDLLKFSERSVRAEAFKCDVNDDFSVAKIFDTLKASGRRIAGVVQLAMVLEDSIFENMSFSQWHRAIQPKTKGSRNLLANIWPGENPFFILLSSITGVIGNPAQANYASGNTFEDALAHHARTHLGINATSIDVGLVSDSTHFTSAGEFGDLENYLGRYQHGWRGLQTNLEELSVVMRTIMRGSTTNGQGALPAQVVLGLGDHIPYNESSTGGFSRDKKFELRVVKTGNQAGEGKTKQDVGTLLSNATSMAEAAAAVEDNIKNLVAAAMGVSIDEVDAQKPLYDYGGKLGLQLIPRSLKLSFSS